MPEYTRGYQTGRRQVTPEAGSLSPVDRCICPTGFPTGSSGLTFTESCGESGGPTGFCECECECECEYAEVNTGRSYNQKGDRYLTTVASSSTFNVSKRAFTSITVSACFMLCLAIQSWNISKWGQSSSTEVV